MKKISAALALLLAGTAAHAGGISEPIGEQKPAVVAKTPSSKGGLLVLALLLLAGAAVAGGGSDGTTEE
ncbi:hypothetical protein [Tabrizicola fusiformis]|uniref:hypothetical protein n=1 Tax=Tabrizicola sp. SY72 TaxID=2741673 RepID=UPI001574B145|nr:hypothetical protein [Tabrizicola sp. SY72]NTT84725.1 hypothetical protein [Tabrizicola sp. SY72]